MRGPDALTMARLIAKQHRLLITEVSEPDRQNPRRYVPAWVVYRSHVRLGRRRDPAALLRFVKLLVKEPSHA